MPETPKYSHSGLTPKERATIDNLEAEEALDIDADEYSKLVNQLIRRKYTSSHELAILRKHLAGIEQGNAFEEYNLYAEECKQEAKNILVNKQ